MNQSVLMALARYDAKMNEALFETVEGLSETELSQSSPIRNSIRTLLQHLLSTKPFFVAACQQRPMDFNRDQLQTASAMRTFARRASNEAETYVASLNDADLARVVEIKLRERIYHFPIWQLLTQAFIHSAQHRGELSALLTQLGHPLPLRDIIVQFIEESGQPAP